MTTALMPFSPVRPGSVFDEVDRLVADVLPATWRQSTHPAVDLLENDDALLVQASIPGVRPEDTKIELLGQRLVISGQYDHSDEAEGKRVLYRERRTGAFRRILHLPMRVDVDKVTASFENGLLQIELPKADEVKPRAIRIEPVPRLTSVEGQDR